MRVAIIDDEVHCVEGLVLHLKNKFPEAEIVFKSTKPEEGLQSLPRVKPDLLFLDVEMPGMNGFDLRDLVKKARPEMPVFLITGRHEIADQDRAQGIDGFFRKPFDGLALLAAVDEALMQSRKERDHEN